MSRKSRKRGGARNVRDLSRAATKSLPSTDTSSKSSDMPTDTFQVSTEIVKFDEELGLVLGWAIVSTVDGEPYFDKQNDHIPEESMLNAAVDFMANSRVAGAMHKAEPRGTVVFAWPMTAEIAKSFGIETKQTGLMIGVMPDDDMLQKFKDGDFTGFSIGGKRGEDEVIDE